MLEREILRAVLVLGFAGYLAAQPAEWELRAEVLDNQGRPVPGARVEPRAVPRDAKSQAADGTVAAKVTDAGGLVAWKVRYAATDYILRVEAAGFLDGRAFVEMPQVGAKAEVAKIRLEPASDSLNLNVKVVDPMGNGIAGAKVRRSGDAIVDAWETPAVTDADGRVTLQLRRISTTYGIRADAMGYRPDGTPVRVTAATTSLPGIMIWLTPLPGVVATVTVSDQGGTVGGANVRFIGSGLLGGTYSGVTDGAGVAKVLIPDEGQYEVEVSEEKHETWKENTQIRNGVATHLQAKLKPRKDRSTGNELLESMIYVTVRSNGRPVRGAMIQANRHSAVETDAAGRGTILGSSAIGDQIVVTAHADGFKSGSALAQLAERGVGISGSRSAVASVTIELVPGKEEVSEDTPVSLLISVVGAKDVGIPGASVTLRFGNGVRTVETTAEDGTMLVKLDGGAVPLEIVRRGIGIEVEAPNYKKTIQTIPSGMLEASNETVEYTATLKPDAGPELRGYLESLRRQVSELRQAVSFYDVSRNQLAASAKEIAATKQQSLMNLRNAMHEIFLLMSNARLICEGVVSPEGLQFERGKFLDEAGSRAPAMLKEIATALQEADRAVEQCQSGDGVLAKQKYTKARLGMAELDKLNRNANEWNLALNKAAKTLRDAGAVVKATWERLNEFETLLVSARKADASAAATSEAAQSAYARAQALAPAVRTSITNVRQRYLSVIAGGPEPELADIPKELDSMEKTVVLVSGGLADQSRALMLGHVKSIKADLAVIETGWRGEVQWLAEQERRAECAIDPRDGARQAVEDAATAGLKEMVLFADILPKAQQCEMRSGTCARDAEDIRLLMENGGIEQAKSRLGAAKQRGCTVADLESELEFYTLVRDATVAIEAANASCRFDLASRFAAQLPARASQERILQMAIYRTRDGLQAQNAVSAYLQAARAQVQLRDFAGAEAALKRAEVEARDISCLLTSISQARAGIQLPVSNPATPGTTAVPAGALKGTVTRSPDKRDDGYNKSYTSSTYADTSAKWERQGPDHEKFHILFTYQWSGVPQALVPGQEYTINVSLAISATPPAAGDGPSLSGNVNFRGDVDVLSAQQADRAHLTSGKYVFRVKPGARNVEIELTGAPLGHILWTYKN